MQLKEIKERSKENRENTATAAARVREGGKFSPTTRFPVKGGLTARHVYDAAAKMKMSRIEADAWIDFMHEVEWTLNDGVDVTSRNFRRSLRMWHRIEANCPWKRDRRGNMAEAQEEGRERQQRAKASRRAEAARQESAWALCAERCAKFQPGKGFKCLCGHALPPDLRERPCPPEECDGFTPNENGKGA